MIMNTIPLPPDIIENFSPVVLGYNEQELPEELQDLNRKVYRFPRDFAMEKQVIRASRIEKQLRDHSFSGAIQVTCSGSWNGQIFFSSNGTFSILPTVPLPYQFIPAGCEMAPFDRQPYSEPLIQWLSPDPSGMLQPQGLLNGSLVYSTPFIYLRLSYLSSWFGMLPPAWPESSFSEEDQKAAVYFGEHLQLDGEWYTDIQSKGAFRRAFMDYNGFFDGLATTIPVKSTENTLLFNLELLPYNGKYLLLPVAFFQYPVFRWPLRLYIPSSGKLPLLGLEKLALYPQLPVILSEEVALPCILFKEKINSIFLSTIGDENALDHTDFTPLRGRKVSWLICNWNDKEDPVRKYKIACKVAALLAEYQISVQFITLTLDAWQMPENHTSLCQQATIRSARLLSKEEMWEKAEENGITVERPLLQAPEMMDANELENEQRMPYLIEPVIRKGSSTVIFGATGVAKSWIALALGCAVAYGKKAFAGRWTPVCPDGGKVLIIAGEMDQGEYGERLRRLNAHYCPIELQKNNLLLHIVEGTVDLAAANGLEQIQAIISHAEKSRGKMSDPIKMVILDNLTTLSTEGENPANFGKIEQVLKWLKARGIAVILIHHENGQGDIRGARKIGDVMTSKFHLYPGETEGDCIGVIIKNEKNRSNKASDMDTFKVVFDFEEPASGFSEAPLTDADLKRIKEVPEDDNEEEKSMRPRKTRYNQTAWKAMSHEERVNAIVEAFRRGDSNEEMAANHNTSRTTICNFRRKYQLRDQDLKQE